MDASTAIPPPNPPRRRLISLKWQAVALVSVVLVLINAAFYFLQSANLERSFNRERETLRATHVALFEGLLAAAESGLQQTGEFMPMLAGMETALQSQDKADIDKAFEELWPTLQVGTGIEGIAFFGNDGRMVSAWGELVLSDVSERLGELVQETRLIERPASTIECLDTCIQYVTVPLLAGRLPAGLALLSASLAGPIIQFGAFTQSDIGIVVAGAGGGATEQLGHYLPAWDMNFVALTRFSSFWPLLQSAAAALPQRPETGKLERVIHENRRFELILFPFTRLASDAPGYFLLATDIEDKLQQLDAEKSRALTIGGVGLLISEATLLAILWSPLARLMRTARALPALARHDFATAHRVLGGAPRERMFTNEIGQVETAAVALAYQLEELNDAIAKRTAALHEKVAELASERDFIGGLLDTAQVIILTQTAEGLIQRCNHYAEVLTGYSDCTLRGRTFASLSRIEPNLTDTIGVQLSEVARGQRKHFEHEALLVRQDGSTRTIAWIHSYLPSLDGSGPAVLSVGLDITARKKADRSIAWLASHDPLTGVYNRHRFQAEFENVLRDSLRHHRSGALLFIDLDHFKYVNDTLGHEAGDILLKTAATEIRRLLRDSDVVARFGGDEFVVLLAAVNQDDATVVAQKINTQLRRVKLPGLGAAHRLSASIGIALFPAHGQTSQDLLKNADLAMYHVKETRRGDAHVYSGRELLRERLANQVYWKNITEEALGEDRFELFYQPIVSIATGQVTHYEALLRLVDAGGLATLPPELIHGAEKTGLIRAIDHMVLTKAVASLRNQRAKGLYLNLAVNLSASAFSDPDLLPLLKELLARSQVSADQLIIEITETAALADFSAACALIDAMRTMGCRFALDDFGAGFSSFYYLKQLPVDYVKIDGGFIQSLARSRDDQILVKAISDVAKGFGKKTIAEFVEDAETLEILRGYEVDYAQGYLLGRPDRMAA